jgi:molecular chaperone DnaJ
VSLKVPAGTSSGRTFRVRGRGVHGKGSSGDLLVTVEVAVPARLTPGAREAIEKLAAELPDDPRPEISEVLRKGGVR